MDVLLLAVSGGNMHTMLYVDVHDFPETRWGPQMLILLAQKGARQEETAPDSSRHLVGTQASPRVTAHAGPTVDDDKNMTKAAACLQSLASF